MTEVIVEQPLASPGSANYVVLVKDIVSPNTHTNWFLGSKVIRFAKLVDLFLLVEFHQEWSLRSHRRRLVSLSFMISSHAN